MNITSAQYFTDPLEGVTILGVKAVINGETLFVPQDPANRHYAAILDWVAEGNTITPAS